MLVIKHIDNMNTEEKYKALVNAMELKTRDDKSEFYAFTDSVNRELIDLFLENYEVRDTDYQIFSKAIDCMADLELEDILKDDFDVYEAVNDVCSVYNSDRLALLNIWNDIEITDILKEYECSEISTACAVWFDREVQNAVSLIISKYIKA